MGDPLTLMQREKTSGRSAEKLDVRELQRWYSRQRRTSVCRFGLRIEQW